MVSAWRKKTHMIKVSASKESTGKIDDEKQQQHRYKGNNNNTEKGPLTTMWIVQGLPGIDVSYLESRNISKGFPKI